IDADVGAGAVSLDGELRSSFELASPWGSGPVRLLLRGAHHVTNATLAAAVALAHGVAFADVAAALGTVESGAGRMQLLRATSMAIVLDDVYNASPASMRAALSALASIPVPGRRV